MYIYRVQELVWILYGRNLRIAGPGNRMDRQPLIIGIDLTNEYCQASYYNLHHARAESVMTGSAVMRYMIPLTLCYNKEKNIWLIGEEAMLHAEETGVTLYKDILNDMFAGAECTVDGKKYAYDTLLAMYFGKLFELIQINSGLMAVESVTVTMRRVNLEVKEKLESVFDKLQIAAEAVRVISYAESFAYYVLNEDESLWKDGALLFDFDQNGFFTKQMTIPKETGKPLVYINENSYSMEFYIKDLASTMLRKQMDSRMSQIYEDVQLAGKKCSVFFTGTGFSELWFDETLQLISRNYRVFKGNNLYVKGAALAGYIRAFKGGRDYPIICRGRTKASISCTARVNGMIEEVELSGACVDWYDASSTTDFILTDEPKVKFIVTSLISQERSEIEMDLGGFPKRADKTTRVQVTVHYVNAAECDIEVKDKGFGEFFEGSGQTVTKRLNLEGYI